jgi:histidinol-phosphate phosphatase family domain/HAD-superfamily hydrolase, subfamily IIIA
MNELNTNNNEKLNKTERKPAVFLDRDGTLIEEVNFLHRVEDLKFFSFTNEAVKLLKEKGFLVIIVTNQSGIGRKIYTEKQMHEIHEAIQSKLTKSIDAFYFCPHLPTDGCRCRKPNPGMIEAACADFSIDLENSWVIGDKALDVELGQNVNLQTALVMTGYGRKDLNKLSKSPHLTTENLLEAVYKIINFNGSDAN